MASLTSNTLSGLFCKREFSGSSFELKLPCSTIFLRSEWPCISKRGFGIYRTLLAIGFVGWVLIDLTFEFKGLSLNINHVQLWFTYATNWAIILYSLSLICLAVTTLYYNFTIGEEAVDHLPGYQFLWLIYEVSITSIATTDIIFWAFLSKSGFLAFSSTIAKAKHAFTLILVLIDLFISAIPVKILHFIYVGIFGILYVIFTVLIWEFNVPGPDGVGFIYPRIDWSNPGFTLALCMLVFFTMILTHILLYVLQFVRNGLASLYKGKRFTEFLEEADDSIGEKLLLRENESSNHTAGGTVTVMNRSSKQRTNYTYDQLE